MRNNPYQKYARIVKQMLRYGGGEKYMQVCCPNHGHLYLLPISAIVGDQR